jgi:hypothetical protein
VGRKQVEPTAWPAFDSPLLQDITSAFVQRGKAIAYETRASGGMSCTREFSESAIGTHERLNLDLWRGHLRMSVWADGEIWLSVCVKAARRNASWAFQDNFYGDARDVPGVAIVGMIEATLALEFGVDTPTERERLRAVWQRIMPR